MAQKISISNARICFRNIAGKPTKFNAKGGVRDFAIILDNYDDVQALIDMGFPIKYFNKKEPTDPDIPYLKVKVNFRFDEATGKELLSPHIYLIDPNKPNKRTLITPQTAEIVDQAEIDYCDIVIRPYYCTVSGNNYTVAYLDKMYVNLVFDEFESKYEMFDDSEVDNAEPIPFE